MPAARYYARSASDRTDDWPLWFVADRERGGLNVTEAIAPRFRPWRKGAVLTTRALAEELALKANEEAP